MDEKIRNKESLSQKTLGGAVWMFLGSGAQAMLRIVFSSILARLLSPADFGVVAIATSVVGFAELFVTMGVGSAIVQSKNITEDHISSAFTFSVLSGFFMAFIFWIINPFIAVFFKMPELTKILNILTWVFPINMISRVSYSLLQKKLKFKKLAGINLIPFIIGYGVVGITLALLGFGFLALIWANLTQSIVYTILLFLRQPHSVKLQLNFKLIRPLLSFGSNLTLANIFNYAALQGDYFIVGRMMGPVALGFYNRAYNLMNISNSVIGTVLNSILFASFSKIQEDKTRQKNSLKKSYALLFITFLPISIITIIMAPEIVYILLGPKWNNTVLSFQILAAGMICRIGYKIGATFAIGMGKIKGNTNTQLIYMLLIFAAAAGGAYIGEIKYVALFVSLALLVVFILSINLATKISLFKWADLFSAAANGAVYSLIIGVVTIIISSALRALQVNNILILIFTLVADFLSTIIILKYKPAILGYHFLWIVKEMTEKVPGTKSKAAISNFFPFLFRFNLNNG